MRTKIKIIIMVAKELFFQVKRIPHNYKMYKNWDKRYKDSKNEIERKMEKKGARK